MGGDSQLVSAMAIQLDRQLKTNIIRHENCTNSSDDIMKRHTEHFHKLNIQIPQEMRELPSFCWLPKMHRNPIGSRFTTASSHCTAKPLSRLLTTCLTTITQHYKEYCDGNTVVNCFWIINNS